MERGITETLDEGIPPDKILIEKQLDLRYPGQSYELTVPWKGSIDQLLVDFHTAHHRAYGYDRQDMSLEIVNARVRAIGMVQRPPIPRMRISNPNQPPIDGHYPVYFSREAGWQSILFYLYEQLKPGNDLTGPAIILAPDTTILVGQSDTAIVYEYENLIISISP